jgi:rRNA-processing protein FCF1
MAAKAPKKKAEAPKKGAAKKSPAKKSASPAPASKNAAPKKAPKAEPAPEPSPVAAEAPPQPEFVKTASPADRKAAMEALLEREKLDALNFMRSPRPPAPLPPAVRETSPVDRKAAVEQLVEESGVASVLRKAPWKRPSAAAPAPPPAPPAPAAPAAEPQRPRVTMTKAPLESTTGRTAPRTVILDSNALMMQFQFHVDIEREVRRILDISYEVIVPSIVVDELRRLSKDGTQKEQAEARMAIELAKTFKVVESPGDGDTAILRLAEKLNAVVVTNDKKLRARLRAKDLANIYMRSRAFLTLEGHIPGM